MLTVCQRYVVECHVSVPTIVISIHDRRCAVLLAVSLYFLDYASFYFCSCAPNLFWVSFVTVINNMSEASLRSSDTLHVCFVHGWQGDHTSFQACQPRHKYDPISSHTCWISSELSYGPTQLSPTPNAHQCRPQYPYIPHLQGCSTHPRIC